MIPEETEHRTLAPSPVIPTIKPLFCNNCTMRCLSSGKISAKPSTFEKSKLTYLLRSMASDDFPFLPKRLLFGRVIDPIEVEALAP
jgi:hypothetical protein